MTGANSLAPAMFALLIHVGKLYFPICQKTDLHLESAETLAEVVSAPPLEELPVVP
jgi:hypothetical protein